MVAGRGGPLASRIICNGIPALAYGLELVFKTSGGDPDGAEAPTDRVGFRYDDRFTGLCLIRLWSLGRSAMAIRAGHGTDC